MTGVLGTVLISGQLIVISWWVCLYCHPAIPGPILGQGQQAVEYIAHGVQYHTGRLQFWANKSMTSRPNFLLIIIYHVTNNYWK